MMAIEAKSNAALLALALIATLVTSAPAQVASPDQEDHSADSLASEQTHRYGILGPVGEPGVYVSSHDDLRLTELVIAAGGVTPNSSRRVRVIRNGSVDLQLVYSPTSAQTLKPGDVVVFEPSGHLASGQVSEWIDVAFVGIKPGEPVVVSLTRNDAALSQVLAALHQDASLINSVHVLRTSRTASPIVAGQLPTHLAEGDVLVFQPGTINHAALAQAESFPPPVLIPSQRQSTHAEPVIQPGTAEDRELSATTTSPTVDEPLHIPDGAISAASELPRELSKPTDPDPPHVAPEQTTEAAGRTVVTTSLIDAPRPATEGLPERSLPATSDDASSFRPFTDPDRDAHTTPNSFPLALSAKPSRPDSEAGNEVADVQLAAVPSPMDPAPESEPNRLASRATLLGITVLMTALICFAASLLWSRLDDATGLTRTSPPADVEQVPLHAHSLRNTLQRLISNSLPMIEEPAQLPNQTDFHGEAVGRERLRIDAEHNLSGPHFSAAARRTPKPEAVSAQAETTQPHREDHFADRPPADVSASTGKTTRQGGLLDRVLVAMEREKRR